MAGALQQPNREIVTPERASAVMRRLGLDWAASPGFLPWPLPPVIPLSRKTSRDWWVGEQLVSYQGPEEDFPIGGSWTSDSNVRDGGKCPEVAAAIIVHCWNRPEWRDLFNLPEWNLELHDVVVGENDDEGTLPFGRALPSPRQSRECASRPPN